MKKVIRYELEEGDLDLLKKDLEPCPCSKCSPEQRLLCGGCEEYREYNEKSKVYKERNLEEFANKVYQYRNLQRERDKIYNEMSTIIATLPKEVQEMLKSE